MVVKYGCMLNVIKFRAISSRSVDQATNNSHFQFLKIYCTPLLIIFTLSLPLFFFFTKNLGGTDYYCPPCKAKFNFELSDSEKGQPRVK